MQWFNLYHDVLIVGAGGFLGAVARYSLTLLVHHRFPGQFPLGTLPSCKSLFRAINGS